MRSARSQIRPAAGTLWYARDPPRFVMSGRSTKDRESGTIGGRSPWYIPVNEIQSPHADSDVSGPWIWTMRRYWPPTKNALERTRLNATHRRRASHRVAPGLRTREKDR